MSGRAYYNEIDPYAAQWLRNLISAGQIAFGDVDERSIRDVRSGDIAGYTQCHFFAGIGGWSLAARMAGWPDCRPIWSGSCPCQPFSAAGKQLGQSDDRHLWPEFSRLISELSPKVIVGEQVAAAIGKHWLDQVFDDLENDGYSCEAAIVPACAIGAPHRRDRLWFVAHTKRNEQPRQKSCGGAIRRMGWQQQPVAQWESDWESSLSKFRALDNGIPRRVGATDAARNAIVPQVAAEIIGALIDTLPDNTPDIMEASHG